LKRSAIIVAGGTGTRMNSDVPKQFLLLSGRPLLMHCLSAFKKASAEIELVIVLPEAFIQEWEKLCRVYGTDIIHKLALGGQTRFHSVKNALSLVSNEGFVAVHDGVRPLVTHELINCSFDSAESCGNAVPAVPVNDSLRSLDGLECRTEDRRRFRIIQTPQVFRASIIKKAYEQVFDVTFTDDATVVERTGEQINLVPGDPRNLKITSPEDLLIAESLFLMNK
jgi:2-C-methyl-D-erythritol 4-phosphate cytidylyltransferase